MSTAFEPSLSEQHREQHQPPMSDDRHQQQTLQQPQALYGVENPGFYGSVYGGNAATTAQQHQNAQRYFMTSPKCRKFGLPILNTYSEGSSVYPYTFSKLDRYYPHNTYHGPGIHRRTPLLQMMPSAGGSMTSSPNDLKPMRFGETTTPSSSKPGSSIFRRKLSKEEVTKS